MAASISPAHDNSATNNNNDPLDGVFTLEDEYYREGYQLGLADGSHAGKLEGRATGLETGFEKFKQMGLLSGKTAVWAGRIAHTDPARVGRGRGEARAQETEYAEQQSESKRRLQRHIAALHALTDAETISTVNDEDACTAFDDRLKRATGKVRVVESLTGDKKALRGEGDEMKRFVEMEVGGGSGDGGSSSGTSGQRGPKNVILRKTPGAEEKERNIEDLGMV